MFGNIESKTVIIPKLGDQEEDQLIFFGALCWIRCFLFWKIHRTPSGVFVPSPVADFRDFLAIYFVAVVCFGNVDEEELDAQYTSGTGVGDNFWGDPSIWTAHAIAFVREFQQLVI